MTVTKAEADAVPPGSERFPGEVEFYQSLALVPDQSAGYDATIGQIDTEEFLRRYNVENTSIRQLVSEVPVLAYTLGRFDACGIVQEGIGFINPPPERVSEVSGLWNHVLGSARLAVAYAEQVSRLSPTGRQILIDQGFTYIMGPSLNPYLFRDTILVSHSGEFVAKQQLSSVHVSTDRAVQTLMQLSQLQAPSFIRILMASELLHTHKPSLPEKLSTVPMLLPQVADWHFGQALELNLARRFLALRKKYGDKNWHTPKGYLEGGPEYLDILLGMGSRFDAALELAADLSPSWLSYVPVPEWERRARELLAASVDKSAQELWPGYQG